MGAAVIQPLLQRLSELQDRLGGSPRIVLLDVDGTLAPIAPRPEDAVVPPETRRAVAALAARPSVHVALVSGRAASDARRLVAVANLWVIGNHGLEIIGPDGEIDVTPEAESHRMAVSSASRKIASALKHVPGVQLEDKGWTLSVHYRRAEPAVIPRLRGLLEKTALQHGLRLTEGKAVYELRPPIDHDKGTAVITLSRRLGGLVPGSTVVFIGDDVTDEDAFRLLRQQMPSAVTARVCAAEDAETAAEFRIPGPDAVREFLLWLVQTAR
jgi:trehalose-phosphatase